MNDLETALPTGVYPALIFGRLDREDGFCLLQYSDSTFTDAVVQEASYLTIDWWGTPGPLVPFESALGHFRSEADPSCFFVLKMVRLEEPSAQPARLVVVVSDDEYSRFDYNPFAIEASGVFAFADSFVAAPRPGRCPLATLLPEARPYFPTHLTPADLRACARPVARLLEGKSLLYRGARSDIRRDRVLEAALWCLPPEIREAYSFMTFTFANRDEVARRRPVLACYFDLEARPWQPRAEDEGQLSNPLVAELINARLADLVASTDKPASPPPTPTESRQEELHDVVLETAEEQIRERRRDHSGPIPEEVESRAAGESAPAIPHEPSPDSTARDVGSIDDPQPAVVDPHAEVLQAVLRLLRSQRHQVVRNAIRGQVQVDSQANWLVVWEPHPTGVGSRVHLPPGSWQVVGDCPATIQWGPDEAPTPPPSEPWHLEVAEGRDVGSEPVEVRLQWVEGPDCWEPYFRQWVLILELFASSREGRTDIGIVGVRLERVSPQ